jgi:hypothetical protein
VPAYFYPTGKGLRDWERLPDAANCVLVVAIVNPASGPGKAADPNYVKLLERAKKSKAVLIGYVATSYGKRPLGDVKKDVDTWLRLYPGVQGIFFDEQASGEEGVAYQAELYQHVRTRAGLKLVVSNPGTACSEKYLSQPAADTVCLFEGPRPFDPAAWPAWAAKYPPTRGCALCYKIGVAEMQGVIRGAVEKRIGTVYVTDAEGANPWDRLPAYWDDEVKLFHEINTAPTGRPGP